MTRRLSVVHVNDVAAVGATLAAEQRRRGTDSHVVDLPKPGAAWPFPAKALAIPVRLTLASGIAARVRRSGPDIVHVHYATQAFVGPLIGAPYVIHCHGSDVRGVDPTSLTGTYLRLLARHATLVLASTPDILDDVRRLRRDAVYLPNPIDTVRFRPSMPPERDVLLASRLEHVKGALVAIDGVADLLVRRPATTVTVVAGGSLIGRARAILGDRVRFVDPVSHEEMPSLLSQHRLVIGQFHLGAIGQLELEAMAVERAVIAHLRTHDPDTSPAPVIAADSPDAIGSAAAAVLDDPSRTGALGRSGRQWVMTYHAVERVVDRLDGLYLAALRRHVGLGDGQRDQSRPGRAD